MATACMHVLLALSLVTPWHLAADAVRHNTDTVDTISDDAGGKAVTVRMLITRHAYSCANAVDEFGENFYQRKKHIYMEDPLLTDCGVHRSKLAAEKLSESPDLVLTSSLLRTMETAAFMYPNATIVPVPYISESGFGADNTPKSVQAQIDTLRTAAVSRRSGLSVARLDLRWMRDEPDFSGAARTSPSWSFFKKFMAETFLPGLPAELRKRELTIAVVTHSNFMRGIPELMSHCKSYFASKPRNNQVLELRYTFTSRLALESVPGAAGHSVAMLDALDPYTDDAAAAWQQFAGIMQEKRHVEALFGQLVKVKPPPWDTPASSIQFERSFKFDERGGCKDLVPVPTSSAQLCEADFGDVCSAEIDALSYFQHPTMYFMEQNRTAAEKELGLAERDANQGRIAQAAAKLDELRNFACCTA